MDQPDPKYVASSRASANFRLSLKIATVVSLAITLLSLVGLLFPAILEFALRPRQFPGLWGIVSAPWLHASPSHLISNIVPLWIGLVLLLYLYPSNSLRAILWIYLGSGLFAWLVGRDAVHLGASGLVYGIMGFLVVSGFIRQDLRALSVALAMVFVYGYIFWGVLPLADAVSWEMHLGGLLCGASAAYLGRFVDRPPMTRYDWEHDE